MGKDDRTPTKEDDNEKEKSSDCENQLGVKLKEEEEGEEEETVEVGDRYERGEQKKEAEGFGSFDGRVKEEQKKPTTVDLGTDGANYKKVTEGTPLFEEEILVEEGLAGNPCATLASAEVVLENGPTPETSPSESRKHLWEHLPVATPIFDADVVVWEYERPKFRKRLGYGFLGRNSASSEHVPPARDPLLTDEDLANPFRCICKLIGIIISLPIYLVYFLCCKMDVWVPELCRTLDFVMFRPVGWCIDWFTCGTCNITWGLYTCLLVPIYSLFVYFARMFRNLSLFLVKHVLLVPVDCMYFTGVLPFCALTTTMCSFTYKKMCVPCSMGVFTAFEAFYINLILPIWKAVKEACRCIYRTLAQACQYIYKAVKSACQCIYTAILGVFIAVYAVFEAFYMNLVLPILKAMQDTCRRIYRALAQVCQFIYKAVQSAYLCIYKAISGFSIAAYRNLLLPCAQGIGVILATIWKGIVAAIRCLLYVVLWQNIILPACNGFDTGVQWTYRNVIVPIGKGFVICAQWLYHNIVLLGMGIQSYVVKKGILVPLGRAIKAVVAFMANILRSIGLAIKAIGTSVAGLYRSMSNAVQAVGTSVAGIFRF